MSEFFSNRHGGIQTATVHQHVKAFDYQVVPGLPQTQQHSASLDSPDTILGPIKSEQVVRSTSQDYAFAIGAGLASSSFFGWVSPELVATQPAYWGLTVFAASLFFFANKQFDS